MRFLVVAFLALTFLAAEVSAQEAPVSDDSWVADAIDDILSDDSVDQLLGEAEQALVDQGVKLTTARDAERRARQRGDAAGRYAARAAQAARSSAAKTDAAQQTADEWSTRDITTLVASLLLGGGGLGFGMRALSQGKKVVKNSLNPLMTWATMAHQANAALPPPPMPTGNGSQPKPSGRHAAVSP